MKLRSEIAVPPDPLDGPRTFGDATDHFKIDPAQARIQAAGVARATRYLHTSFIGTDDFVSVTGGNLARVRYLDGAIFAADWVTDVPPWVDLADDFTLYVPAHPCLEDTVLDYRLYVTLVRDGVSLGTIVHDSTQTTFIFEGNNFGATAGEIVFLPFVTFNASTVQLQANDVLHVNLTRYGGDALDTINAAWYVAASPFFTVKQKELA